MTNLETFRSMLQHEDDLRNQRFGWFITFNGLLFTAVAFGALHNSEALVLTIAAVGVLASVSFYASMRLSDIAIAGLVRSAGSDSLPAVAAMRSEDIVGAIAAERQARDLRKLQDQQEPGVTTRDKMSAYCIRLLYPWRLIPLVLFASWLAVGIFVRA